MSPKESTFMRSLKLVLMSTGVVFIAILITISLPSSLASAAAEVPSLWTALKSWLRPPYLYFIINGIIITIVASSRLHHHQAPASEGVSYAPPAHKVQAHHQHDVIPIRAEHFSPYDAALVKDVEVDDNQNGVGLSASVVGSSGYEYVSVKDVGVVEEVKKVAYSPLELPLEVEIAAEEVVVDDGEEMVDAERTMWSPPPLTPQPLMRQGGLENMPEFFSERPPASARFAHHRRPSKVGVNDGGKALRRVAKPKKHETFESTWKAITEGRHIPLTRHLKKSDAWENQDRQIDLLDDSFPLPEVKKSQTFNDRTNRTSPPVSSTKLRKEPSLGQDELNRRVEAFINKFNEDMKLQRQQSMQQFTEMINRAA